jgi:beta-N-acetylhexosaminidase
MGIPESPVSRRDVLLAGAAVIGGLGLGGTARAAAPGRSHKPVKLSLTQQAGQRVVFSYPGLTPPTSLLDQISAGEVGGVIFFGENISGLSQIAAVVNQLKEAHAQSPITSPLLLTTDQEGGRIRRLPGEPALSEKQIGASADPLTAARGAGIGAGENLAGVGMNANLAPVLDVFRVRGNFDDQFQRSYSLDPAVCGELGAAFITAQQGLGIAATAKHFPGLGAASRSENTDLTRVTLDLAVSELRAVDELPYGPAIDAGVQLVMASWAVYPALDPERPAGLSPTIIEGELRDRLGFRGVTITDALEAGSLAPFGTSAQRSVLAAQAGMDMLLCSARDVSQGQSTVAAVAEALQSHELNPGHAKAALRRVLALRDSLA